MQRHFPTKEAWGAFLIDFVSPVAATLGSREEGPCAHSFKDVRQRVDQPGCQNFGNKEVFFMRLKNMEDIVSTVLYIRVFHDYSVICEAILSFLLIEQK